MNTTREDSMNAQEIQARIDAKASARHAMNAAWLRENVAAGSVDGNGTSVETLISALERASK
jgi:hypothetical protein